MPDIEALAAQLTVDLTNEERARLLMLLAQAGGHDPDVVLAPRLAGQVCSATLSTVTRSLNTQRQVTQHDLDQMGEALFYGFDSFYTAMESATRDATGDRGRGLAHWWCRASYDALNLRDHIGHAVSKDYEWSDDPDAVS
ncbi:hypothetical protein ABZ829_27715 [Streptomyces xanthochromogenes]|uniref:hypothetical protein n=1 Tax=Streptomyces xanthochromogenes TaxID=67384 RepID=UPI003414213A